MYIKRKHTIDAMQFTVDNFEELENFTDGAIHSLNKIDRTCEINNLYDYDTIKESNYVVKISDNRFKIMKDWEFEEKYVKF